MILDKIVDKKKIYIENQKKEVTFDDVKKKALSLNREVLNFYDALKGKDKISIIAEVKKASPSKGLICENFVPRETAKEYMKAGASAISVLTEEDFFQGSPRFLKDIKEFSTIPVLRKDFIIDEYQIYEAFNIGADAILLIAAILSDEQLKRYKEIAHSLNLKCLTEVHNEEELKRILELGFDIIGINNRNLYTFEEDLTTTGRLIEMLPKEKVVVSESGIRSRSDMEYLEGLGVNAVLIGEMFMRADSISDKFREIRGEL